VAERRTGPPGPPLSAEAAEHGYLL
jgi:hypothetical protein